MAPAGSFKRVSQPRGTEVSSLSDSSPNTNDIIMVGSDPDNHYRQMLANMSSLVEAENLTDMTIQCSEGYNIYTHKKILSSVSPVVRKLSREHGGLGENQRLHLILNDVSRQTVSHFLKLLYTGYTDRLNGKDLDMVHALCQLLEVVLNDNSLTFYSTSVTTKKSKEATKGIVRDHSDAENRFSMGLEKPIPSVTFKNLNYGEIISVKTKSGVTRKENLREKMKECLAETEISKVNYGEGEGNYGVTKKEGNTDLPVYCICREEERPGMIGCDYCDEWYHTQCLSLSKEEVKRLANENWSCPNCEFKKIKSRKQSTTMQSPLKSPPFSIQDTKIIEAKGGIKDEIVGKKISTNTNTDVIGTWKAASPATRTAERHANTVATPQRNKRKRHAQLEAAHLNDEKNDDKESLSERGDNMIPDVKKSQESLAVKSPTKQPDKMLDNTSTSTSEEITSLIGKGSNAASTLQENIHGVLNKEEPKSSKESSSALNPKCQLTSNRMTVPLRKKPKKSFEEALFEVAPLEPCTKKQPGMEGQSSTKPALTRSLDKGDESSSCLSSGEKKHIESTLKERSAELTTTSTSVTTRTTSVQSRGADDENSSPTDGNKNGKAKRLKKRSEFPTDRDIDTTSTHESSEDRGPFSPPSPKSPLTPPVHLHSNITPDQGLRKGNQTRKRKRTIPPIFPSNQRQTSLPKSPEEEDSTSLLFFCYNCKSIFVSKAALDSHRKDKDHYE